MYIVAWILAVVYANLLEDLKLHYPDSWGM